MLIILLKCWLSYPIVGLPPTSHKLYIKNAPSKSATNALCMYHGHGTLPCPPPASSSEDERISWSTGFVLLNTTRNKSRHKSSKHLTWESTFRRDPSVHQDLPRRHRTRYSRHRSVCCSPFLYIYTGFDPYVSSSDSSLQPERFSVPTTTTPHNSFRRSY
jgi:hypothetical protein